MIFYKSVFPPPPPPLAKFSIYREQYTSEQNTIVLIYKSYLNVQNIVQAHKHSLYIVVT